MTARDMRDHLREMYQVEVSPDLISRVTDAVADELAGRQARPRDAVWPVIFIDPVVVKVRDGVVANRRGGSARRGKRQTVMVCPGGAGPGSGARDLSGELAR